MGLMEVGRVRGWLMVGIVGASLFAPYPPLVTFIVLFFLLFIATCLWFSLAQGTFQYLMPIILQFLAIKFIELDNSQRTEEIYLSYTIYDLDFFITRVLKASISVRLHLCLQL
jgi:hypothetical protein